MFKGWEIANNIERWLYRFKGRLMALPNDRQKETACQNERNDEAVKIEVSVNDYSTDELNHTLFSDLVKRDHFGE